MSNCGWFPMRHDEIIAWVRRHRAELPADLVGLSRFPMPFRAVIANEVDLPTRTRYWTEHLQTFLASDSELSDAQRDFIRRTIPDLPQLLRAPAPNPVMTEWEARAATMFVPTQAARVFGMLGPPEPPEGLPLPPDTQPGA